jgi:uncharacterized membrane-anchored protein
MLRVVEFIGCSTSPMDIVVVRHCDDSRSKMKSDLPGKMAGRAISKVPEITVYFWIIKILTTAMGEATSDFLVFHINAYLAVILGALGFAMAVALQFWVKKYIAWVYWLLVVMVSIFGTMVADVVHVVLGVPYYASTSAFALALAVVLVLWHRIEKTLSIHSIFTVRRECFYWATVLATFALGTAAGDMTASTLHLGYLVSGLVFTILFIIPGVGYWLLGLNDIFSFWFAYIMTRPLGASFADWFDKPRSMGGLGFGTPIVSVILTLFIVVFVAYVAIARVDIEPRSVKLPELVNTEQLEGDA